jgi:hypothetical protein
MLGKALASSFFIPSYALYRTGADLGPTPENGPSVKANLVEKVNQQVTRAYCNKWGKTIRIAWKPCNIKLSKLGMHILYLCNNKEKTFLKLHANQSFFFFGKILHCSNNFFWKFLEVFPVLPVQFPLNFVFLFCICSLILLSSQNWKKKSFVQTTQINCQSLECIWKSNETTLKLMETIQNLCPTATMKPCMSCVYKRSIYEGGYDVCFVCLSCWDLSNHSTSCHTLVTIAKP